MSGKVFSRKKYEECPVSGDEVLIEMEQIRKILMIGSAIEKSSPVYFRCSKEMISPNQYCKKCLSQRTVEEW